MIEDGRDYIIYIKFTLLIFPKIVAKVHDEMATIKEFFKASCNVSWYKRVSNH